MSERAWAAMVTIPLRPIPRTVAQSHADPSSPPTAAVGTIPTRPRGSDTPRPKSATPRAGDSAR
jgi:hypothetical protein